MTKSLIPGQRVKIEFPDGWLPGTFEKYVIALDREFRVSVIMDNGVELNECAPECVKPFDQN